MNSNFILSLLVVISLITVVLAGYLYHNESQRSVFVPPKVSESKSDKGLENQDTHINEKMIPFDRLIINLRGDNGRRMLSLTFEINVKIINDSFLQEFEGKRLILRDSIISIVSDIEYSDIAEGTGPATIKKKIIDSFNAVIKSAVANDVYFTQFETN